MNDEKMNTKKEDEIYCSECGKPIKRKAVICPHCGVQIKDLEAPSKESKASKTTKVPSDITTTVKSKLVAILLAVFFDFGGFFILLGGMVENSGYVLL